MKRILLAGVVMLMQAAPVFANPIRQDSANLISLQQTSDTSQNAAPNAANQRQVEQHKQQINQEVTPVEASRETQRSARDRFIPNHYPGYCPYLSEWENKESWEYREAVQNCRHGF
jgi:hypothetical protein